MLPQRKDQRGDGPVRARTPSRDQGAGDPANPVHQLQARLSTRFEADAVARRAGLIGSLLVAPAVLPGALLIALAALCIAGAMRVRDGLAGRSRASGIAGILASIGAAARAAAGAAG